MIESYSFGAIVIDGKTYTSDVIILPDRVNSSWWRKEGHALAPEDIQEVLSSRPEVLVVGTGASGVMEILPQTKKLLEENRISLVAKKTSQACDAYNKLAAEGRKVFAALHLTC
jgi:hypothetical protein